MTSEPTVWALGAKNINANKAVGWDEPFPNFADPDVLIVNLESLDSKTLERVDRAKILKAKEDIFDKFSHSAGNIIFITSHAQSYKVYNNKDLSPLSFNVVPVQEGSNIKVENGHPFSQYLSKVGRFSFYLEQFDIALEIISKLKRNKNELFLETLPNQTARDNAGHVLSISFKVISHPATTKYSSGQIAFLPPCKDISTEEAINDIIEVFKKKESKETPPEWTSLIDLPGLKNVNDEIAQLNSTKASIEAQISTSQMKKETLEAHSRLLYATGTALEDSVYNAFKLIGLDDITRLREKNKEDWVFKFQTANEFEYGI